MKQVIKSGERIFQEIEQALNDVNEIRNAMGVVSEDIGENSLPYRLLKEQYAAKQTELNKLKRADWTPADMQQAFE